MNNILEFISLDSLNSKQRQGLFFLLTSIAVAVFLHFPFDGYVTTDHYSYPANSVYISEECRKNFIELYGVTKEEAVQKAMSASEDQIDLSRKCSIEKDRQMHKVVDRPFDRWESAQPVFSWFGRIVNVISVIVLAIVIGVIWLWIFREDSKVGS